MMGGGSEMVRYSNNRGLEQSKEEFMEAIVEKLKPS